MTRTRRYLVALLLVAASLVLRLSLQSWLGDKVPFLQFFPAIMLAAWFGGFGPGVVAVGAAAALAVFFFLPPTGGLGIANPADSVSLVLFVLTGAGIAWFNHRLRRAEEQREAAADLGGARAQELQAILDTAVDGIIVIDTQGRIEAFNRGAERLFGYPAADIVGQNVRVLMPSPDHERHDGYLARAQAMQGRGNITVSVDGDGSACRVKFADQGPGIPPEVREKVFTPFFTTKTRGSGLGLPTCRRLIEAHRGTLAIDCPPQGGTTVTVTLPAAPAG